MKWVWKATIDIPMQPPGTHTSRLSRVGHFRYLPNYLVVISRLVLSVMAGTEASE